MLITELLDKYRVKSKGLAALSERKLKNAMLKNDLTKLKSAFPSIEYCFYWLSNKGYSVSYETVTEFFNSYSVYSYKDFVKWNTALADAKITQILADTNIYQPLTLDINQMLIINSNDLADEVKWAIPDNYKERDMGIQRNDNAYYVLNKPDIYNILENSAVDMLTYMAEGRDCEDFANLLKCYVRRYGYGNTTLAVIELNLFKIKDSSGIFHTQFAAHAINLVYYFDGNGKKKVAMIEPQTDTLLNFGDIICGTRYYRIRKITF